MTTDVGTMIEELTTDIHCQVRGGRTPEQARDALLRIMRRYVTNTHTEHAEAFMINAAYCRACYDLGVPSTP